MNFRYGKFKSILLLLWVSGFLYTSQPYAQEESKPVFTADSMFVDAGGSSSAVFPASVLLQKDYFFYNALVSVMNDASSQNDLLRYETLRRWKSGNKFAIQNKGYLRSEFSIGNHISIGAMLANDRLAIRQVPFNLSHYSSIIYEQLAFYAIIIRDGASIPAAQDNSVFLYSEFLKSDSYMNIDSFTPELGLHLSNSWFDFYLRAGASILDLPKHVSGWRGTGSIGIRSILYDPITFHIEAYGNRWSLSSTGGPGFDIRFNEFGIRSGFGVRLEHP